METSKWLVALMPRTVLIHNPMTLSLDTLLIMGHSPHVQRCTSDVGGGCRARSALLEVQELQAACARRRAAYINPFRN